jgi:diadenosine tetraphosphate (Ap4A) HIT family hydrolase
MKKYPIGLTPGSSVIYIPEGSHTSQGLGPDDYVHEYEHWHLVLQPPDKRKARGIAAGLLIAKRQVMLVTELLPEEWADLANVFAADENGLADAPRRLAEAVGVEFTGHFTAPAFNMGSLAGQTQAQVHGHIYPVVAEQLPPPGTRNGMGAFIEAHRQLNNL